MSNQSRHLIVLSGSYSDCLSSAKEATKDLDCLLLTEQKKAHSFLGQEFDAVIFNCHSSVQQKNSFDANAFGAIAGTIRANGYLILLKPLNETCKSLFLKRFWAIVDKTEHQYIDCARSKMFKLEVPQPINYQTNDQKHAIDKVIHVVKGHRRRPLVITADRGRGKSAALGIAAASLIEEGYENIIVCAPSKKTAAIIFKHASKNNPEYTLTFYSPDELQQQKPEADLVLIDEAAAIPIPLLSDFLKHYSRIVFATTQHGYEGSGRGFSINFKKILSSVSPEWINCTLHAPIRWGSNDTLERFVFEVLLLNAEPAKLNKLELDKINTSHCKIVTLDKTKLVKKSTMLSELFGLLVSAHYQTKPSDLMHLLDDDQTSIHVTQYKEKIIAVALLVQEGGIESKIATDIFEGTRRLQGNLVAQSLAANVGIENAPCLQGERIMRIAVHPDLQQRGFGSAMLKFLIDKSRADYLSTSFAASKELIPFWKQLAFIPVYLGMKRDASSGTHSIVMLHKKTKAGDLLISEAQQRFERSFPYLLSEPFNKLESELVLLLLSPHNDNLENKKELIAFAKKQRGYENTLYALWNLVCSKLSNTSSLTNVEKEILVLKVLQKQSWPVLINNMEDNILGKKDALKLLRKAVGGLLE